MKNGSFDVVKEDDRRAEEWEIAPNTPDRCNILHLLLSCMTDKEKDAIITTFCNELLINANLEALMADDSQS